MRFATTIATAATLCAATNALAHGGHGAPSVAHWHATDTFGLVLVAGLTLVAIWFGRK